MHGYSFGSHLGFSSHSGIEPLEARIAPAGVFTYTDFDGDLVTVKTTKGSNAELAAAITLMDVAGSVPGGKAAGNIVLGANPNFEGTSFTLTAKRGPLGGNGLANVELLSTGSLHIGTITINGDLSGFFGGVSDGSKIKAINLHSSTGNSIITVGGNLGALNIKTDVVGTEFNFPTPGATVDLIKIGGSLSGRFTVVSSGLIEIPDGTLKSLIIGGDLAGTAGTDSGSIQVRNLNSASIGGSLIGGTAAQAGSILVTGTLGQLTVKGDVIGGSAANTGLIHGVGGTSKLGAITIGGNLLGGSAAHSGNIEGDSQIGLVKIGRNVVGGSANNTGDIVSTGAGVAGITVGGSLIGGTASFTGRLLALGGDMGPVKIGRDVIATERNSAGALLVDTGIVYAQLGTAADTPVLKIASITIGGNVFGGGENTTGQLYADGSIGPVKIVGDLIGKAGNGSGSILTARGTIGDITIGGDLKGGSGTRSGLILAGYTTTGSSVGNTVITGSVLGGSGIFSGGITSDFIGNVTIGGDISTGTDPDSGFLKATVQLGAVKISGSLIGTSTAPVLLTTSGLPGNGPSLKSLTIAGSVTFANLTFGIGTADAQVGAVKVGGNWTASNLVAGIQPGDDELYGTSDDALPGNLDQPGIFSRIASITIGGRVEGTPGSTDHYAFISQEIGALKVNGIKFALQKGPGNDSNTAPQNQLGTTTSNISLMTVRDMNFGELA